MPWTKTDTDSLNASAQAPYLIYNTQCAHHAMLQRSIHTENQLHCTGAPVPMTNLLMVLIIDITMTVHPNATTPIARYLSLEFFFDNLM